MPQPSSDESTPIESVSGEPIEDESNQQAPAYHGAQNHCFGCGQGNPVGLHLHFVPIAEGSVICSATITGNYEGPPGYLHGGIIATLLDEAMSKANRSRNVTAMTRQMQVEYLRPVPSGSPIRIEGRVLRSEGRKHWTSAEIFAADGKLLASASGFFIAIAI